MSLERLLAFRNNSQISDIATQQAEVATQLDSKVGKIEGKGLSTNDYDNVEKTEVAKVKNKADKIYVDTTKDNLNSRIDNIIATPTTVSEQEIIDARQGGASLGANITSIKDELTAHKAESVSQGNPHGIDTKANKSWEDYIELNCLNEWTPNTNFPPRISKNDLGEVHLMGRFNTGILARSTTICNIPIGYRPENATPVVAYTYGDKSAIGFFIAPTSGDLRIIEPASRELSTSTVFIDINIIYKAKE